MARILFLADLHGNMPATLALEKGSPDGHLLKVSSNKKGQDHKLECLQNTVLPRTIKTLSILVWFRYLRPVKQAQRQVLLPNGAFRQPLDNDVSDTDLYPLPLLP